MKSKEPGIYSVTSNTPKLLKHLDILQNIQDEKLPVVPIMIHSVPTNKCQLKCVHCCFKNRDMQVEVEWKRWKDTVDQFVRLGTKSLEFTGGGDPTMWPHLDKAVAYLKDDLGFSTGVITNGLGTKDVKNWGKFDWVRVSLNTLDYYKDMDIDAIIDSGTTVSFCYIWNHVLSEKKMDRVAAFTDRYKIICRFAPDCITTTDVIDKTVEHMREVVKRYPENKYIGLSDFNVQTTRRNNQCRIHMIKPCMFSDGWIYSCPSSQLALENQYMLRPKTRICKYEDVYEFYNNSEATKVRQLNCSYCKYAKQNEFLEDLTMETTFNEFA
jgi:organic radical activating enzyme